VLSHSANLAYIPQYGHVKLNGVIVWQSAWADANIINSRGVNVALVNTCNCSVVEPFRQFDTHAQPSAGMELNDYLQQVDYGAVVIGVSADSPADIPVSNYLQQAYPALNAIGVDVSDVLVRGAFGFVAQKGLPDKTVLRKILTETEAFHNPPHFNVTVVGRPTLQFSFLCGLMKRVSDGCTGHAKKQNPNEFANLKNYGGILSK